VQVNVVGLTEVICESIGHFRELLIVAHDERQTVSGCYWLAVECVRSVERGLELGAEREKGRAGGAGGQVDRTLPGTADCGA
jgi:hypothetical protein